MARMYDVIVIGGGLAGLTIDARCEKALEALT